MTVSAVVKYSGAVVRDVCFEAVPRECERVWFAPDVADVLRLKKGEPYIVDAIEWGENTVGRLGRSYRPIIHVVPEDYVEDEHS